MICGWILGEALGDPTCGIAPHTPFEQYPSDWKCPECRVGKGEFAPFLDG
ncbi:MAG: rubredoxin [Fibrobacterota bacterium]|nr:MAG: rubredoxin [Fibrobacterota bacterium]